MPYPSIETPYPFIETPYQMTEMLYPSVIISSSRLDI